MTDPGTLSPAELVDRVSLQDRGWAAAVCAPGSVGTLVSELQDEFEGAVDDGVKTEVVSGRGGAFRLVAKLLSMPSDSVALVRDIDDLKEEDWRHLDSSRNALMSVRRVVLVLAEQTVQSMAGLAPNLWSWIGPRVWGLDEHAGELSVDARIASLRSAFDLTDDQVVAMAEAGTLRPDPALAEWLVLLGRGDLVGR